MNEIILLGPPAVGKSTTAKLLAKKLNLKVVSLDDLCKSYYKEIGYNHKHMKDLWDKVGIMAAYQYGKIFDPYSIERVLEDCSNCIFDFGGGNNASGFNFELERMEKALKAYKNVVLLYPCPDKIEALKFVHKRKTFSEEQRELIEHIVKDESNFNFAKHTIFVKGKTPEQVCDEVLAKTQI